MKAVKELTLKYGVLLICDEVQVGLGRTGTVMANHHDLLEHGLKPDIITLGKALSGSFTPASGIMADHEITQCLKASDIGSTFGGNALTMAIVRAAIGVLREEGLVENAKEVGSYMREKFQHINSNLLVDVRGRGLMNAIEVDRNSFVNGHDLCNIMQ